MKTLTIEHLAAYLPYNLKLKWDNGHSIDTITMEGIDGDFICHNDIGYNGCPMCQTNLNRETATIKLILRPLSQLTEPITHNGETFVPAGKMITHGFHNTFWYETEKFDHRYLYVMDYEKLLSWHFDIFNLGADNLCVYVNNDGTFEK